MIVVAILSSRELDRVAVRTGRLAQRESAALTRQRSKVRILQRPRSESAGHRSFVPSWVAFGWPPDSFLNGEPLMPEGQVDGPP